jgi:hypothetical protein
LQRAIEELSRYSIDQPKGGGAAGANGARESTGRAIEPALMTSLAHFLLLAALLLPAFVADRLPDSDEPALTAAAATQRPPLESGLQAQEPGSWPLRVLEEAREIPVQNQVRIERRVIIRITPGPAEQRARMLATLPRRPIASNYQEVEHGDCVAVANIAGVHASEDDRLLLFLHDRRVLTADLERSCSARAFYMGFYVERNEDGQLCVARDRLQSRSGASCQIGSLHRLVAARD